MQILSAKNYSLSVLLVRVRRNPKKAQNVENAVRKILDDVRQNKDKALFSLAKKFDGAQLFSLRVSKKEIAEAYAQESAAVIAALRVAKTAIEKFERATLMREPKVVTATGVKVWREFRPIERVGLYIPGGKAVYQSPVLMLGVPAKIAGCKEVVLCVPPDPNGKAPSAVLVAADLCGITKIFKVGGAQAIAAMAYGTQSIPKVSKIFGPGNQYVTTAKLLVYGEVDIDMPAGPSEVLVFADESANPSWIAADLLAQLEHSEDAQAILVTLSKKVAQEVRKEMFRQCKSLSRQRILCESLKNSFGLVFTGLEKALRFINEYAPEHLEIVSRKESEILAKVINAGSVFLGAYSSEPLGDYATGSNHTLPTGGYAKMFSPLSLASFGKKMQIQKISKTGMKNLQTTVETLAEREGLDAHKNAISIRFKKNI